MKEVDQLYTNEKFSLDERWGWVCERYTMSEKEYCI